MKFIADVMLGRLAKRMRLMGFDVLYDRTLNDNDLLRLSLDQCRTILTRDVALAGRPLAADHLFIKSDRVSEQLGQVYSVFSPPSSSALLTRCSVCNEPLLAIAREKIKDLVPVQVYGTGTSFLYCKKCRRVYWKGSHVKKMILQEVGE